jgi:hypothetical protein
MVHKVEPYASAIGLRWSREHESRSFDEDARKIVGACRKFDFQSDTVTSVEKFLGFVTDRRLSPLLGSFLSETVSGPMEAYLVESAHARGVARAAAATPRPVHLCLAPGCGAQAGRRKHVITRAGTLASIKDATPAGDVVYAYVYDKFRRMADLRPQGLGEAATFPGFCDACDNTLFRSVENGAFTLDHHAACLLAWRAALNTIVRKARQCRERIHCLASDDTSFDRHGRNSLAHELKQNLSEFRDSLAFRAALEAEIFADASQLASAYVTLPDPLPYVAAGTFSPRLSLSGTVLQDVNDWRQTCALIGFNTVRDASGVHLLFVWNRDGAVAPFMNELLASNLDALGNAILRIAVVFTEFVFFRRSWVEDPANAEFRAEILRMFDLADLPLGAAALAPLRAANAIGKGRLDSPPTA